MNLVLQPVHVVGTAWHVFPQENAQLLVATDPESAEAGVRAMLGPVEAALRGRVELREPIVIREPGDRERVLEVAGRVDGLLVSLSGGLDADLWDVGCPVIAFSGERTPMMGLYALPLSERRKRPDVRYCLDTREVLEAVRDLRLRRVKQRLDGSRMLVLGEYRCAEKLPDPQVVREKLGVEFVHVPSARFVAEIEAVAEPAARAVAEEWSREAVGDSEPSAQEILDGARVHVALSELMQRERAQAVSVGCLEVMYLQRRAPFCFVLARLRDAGLPAGCEADAGATLTMLMLDLLADRPAYMGNLVQADPAANLVSISHGCSPSRVWGRDRPAKGYRLVHSHSAPPFSRDLTGGSGVTSYVDYGDVGEPVTIARLDADVATLFAARGEIVECRDTICDRTTLTVRVSDARGYVRHATGNHQVVIYGDFVDDLRALGPLLDLEVVGP